MVFTYITFQPFQNTLVTFSTKFVALCSILISITVFAIAIMAINLTGNIPLSKLWSIQGLFFVLVFSIVQPIFSFLKNKAMVKQVAQPVIQWWFVSVTI